MLEPIYVDRRGATGTDPMAMVSHPTVNVEALACWFAPPAFFGEFIPRSPWQGLERLRREPIPEATDSSLRHLFSATIERLIFEVGTIGVRVSGGLDSLAVLVHALNHSSERRVIAFCVDLLDDAGCSSLDTLQRLLVDLNIQCELIAIDPVRHHRPPRWSVHGPNLAAMPWVEGALAQQADDAGVELLLSGDGANQLLRVPCFATAHVWRRHGWKAALRYLGDARPVDAGATGELAALLGAVIPDRLRMELYWALNLPAFSADHTMNVLTSQMRAVAADWMRSHIQATICAHVSARSDWATADASDSWWPCDPIPAAGRARDASPFLSEPFLSAALALSIGDRYEAKLSSPYHRRKAQVIRLFEPEVVPALPLHKQFFSRAFAELCPTFVDAPRCIEAGLLDADRVRSCHDPAILLLIGSMEEWLAGAEAAGAIVPGLSAARSTRVDPPL